MKYLPYAISVIFAGILLYQTAYQNGMMQETLRTSQHMTHQLDSMWSILSVYEATRQDYETATQQLSAAHAKVLEAQQDLLSFSTSQKQEIMGIRERLRLLTQTKQNHHILPPDHVDSLLFRP